MNKKIDKIQKDIDELIELLAEAGAEGSDFAEDLDVRGKVGYLALKLQDNELEPEQLKKLEQWLLADRKILQHYIDFQNLNALLYTYYNKNRLGQLIERVHQSIAVEQ